MVAPENRDWRVVQEVRNNLTEREAREFIKQQDYCYAENSLHEYIESFDGPVTVGRPAPEVR